MKKLIFYSLVGLWLCGAQGLLAQFEAEPPGWDQFFFFGNKVAWGADKWKYSGELQIRLQDLSTSAGEEGQPMFLTGNTRSIFCILLGLATWVTPGTTRGICLCSW